MNQRTLLLFVIRDHVGATPLANLQATLSADMNKLWDSISKPPELQDRKLSDYFDLIYTTLPHKILVPDQFEAQVRDLGKRFSDKDRTDYLFKPAYHKRIPADGVAFYMEGIWVSRIFSKPTFVDYFDLGTSPNEQGLGSANPTRASGSIPMRRNLHRCFSRLQ